MIVTLTGDDSYAMQAELKSIVASFVDSFGDMALERLEGGEASYAQIQAAVQSIPFLSDRKLLVLREPSANKQFIENAEALVSNLPETTDLVIVEPKLDKRSVYYKFLKQATDYREQGKLEDKDLAAWLAETAKDQGGSLSTADARFLIERIGSDRPRLANELEKLLLYDPQVTRQTVELLTEAEPQSSIFDLLAAAFAGNMKQALALYRDQREQRIEPPRIIAMLTWQLWVLAVVKAAGNKPVEAIAREAKLNPYVVQKSQRIARELSMLQLRGLVLELLAIDARSKRESIDIDEALQNYFLTLAS